MLQRADFYRSREENAGNMFPRHEPIVHSAGSQREQGPLAQQQLAQFERDGFLWLENFFTPEMVEGFFDEWLPPESRGADPEAAAGGRLC